MSIEATPLAPTRKAISTPAAIAVTIIARSNTSDPLGNIKPLSAFVKDNDPEKYVKRIVYGTLKDVEKRDLTELEINRFEDALYLGLDLGVFTTKQFGKLKKALKQA